MLDNEDIRASLVAWLKANTTINVLHDNFPIEIRERDWQGEDFTYPNIRVTCSSIPNQCNYSDMTGVISFYSEQKSSKEALNGQGVIAKQIHKRTMSGTGGKFVNVRVTSLPDAVRDENGVWRADVNISALVHELLLPFSQNFAEYGDGTMPGGWIGATWAILSGSATNVPTLEGELFTNTGFDTDTVWSKQAGWTIGSGVASHAPGSASGIFQGVLSGVAGIWLQMTWEMVKISGSDLAPSFGGNVGTYIATSGNKAGAGITSTSLNAAYTASSTFEGMIDNASCKKIIQSSMFSIRNVGTNRMNVQGTYKTFNDGTPIGVLVNVSQDFSSGIVAFITDALALSRIKLYKWVGTTWTLLINSTQTISNNLLPQIITSRSGSNLLVDLKYNGITIGTQQTVSNVEIIDNTYAGIFSTYSGNSIAVFSAEEN